MRQRSIQGIALWMMACVPLACGGGKSKSGAAGSASAAASASAPTPPASVAASASAAPSASAPTTPEKPKIVRRTGTVGEFFNTARALDLKDDQKEKLDKIDEEIFGEPKEDEATRDAYKEFSNILIEGVKAGRVDTAKLGPQYAVFEKAAKERHDAEAKALNELHEILDATQRKSLVETLRKRHPGQTKKPPAAPATPAKPPAKPGTPAAPKPAQPDKNAAAEHLKRRVARVTALVGLDEMQQKRIEPIMARFDTEPLNKTHREQVEKRMQALINAFEKDQFDATKLDLGKGPKARMENRVSFITSILAILKADQREKYARTIERAGARRWGGAVAGEAGPADDE